MQSDGKSSSRSLNKACVTVMVGELPKEDASICSKSVGSPADAVEGSFPGDRQKILTRHMPAMSAHFKFVAATLCLLCWIVGMGSRSSSVDALSVGPPLPSGSHLSARRHQIGRDNNQRRSQNISLRLSNKSAVDNQKSDRSKSNDGSENKSKKKSSNKTDSKRAATAAPLILGAELYEKLDDKFEYIGRLPSHVHKQDFRCGYVGILGAPNMGKSTLLNALLEEELCIATRRPQTTRHSILGVLTTASSQLCLLDTPGIIDEPAYKLQEGMMEAVQGTFKDSDAILVVTDLFSTPIPDDAIFEKLIKSKKPVVVAINKIDLEGHTSPPHIRDDDSTLDDKTYTVAEAVAKWRKLLPDALAIIPLSAAEGVSHSGVSLLRMILVGEGDISAATRNLGRPIPGMFQKNQQFISNEEAKTLLPLGPPLYDEDVLTDRSERFFCAELIREAIFECLNKEVPYCCEVQVHSFKVPISENRRHNINIKANIYVERDSQKGIVVGKGGQQLKEIGIMARKKIELFLDEPVTLGLYVLVSKDWRKNEDQLKRFGYMKSEKPKKR